MRILILSKEKEYKRCKCGHYYVKNGKNKHGDQKYICGKKCGSSFVDSDRKVGRPCLFDKPLTGKERTARNRAKNSTPPIALAPSESAKRSQ
jgi:transposase-like protein